MDITEQLRKEILEELREEIKLHTSSVTGSLVHPFPRVSDLDQGPSTFVLRNVGLDEANAVNANSDATPMSQDGMFLFTHLGSVNHICSCKVHF